MTQYDDTKVNRVEGEDDLDEYGNKKKHDGEHANEAKGAAAGAVAGGVAGAVVGGPVGAVVGGALGAGRFEVLFELGRDASMDQVMDLALKQTRPDGGTAPTLAARPTTELSPRETEVVALIVRGLSNAEIGQTLVISTRTAETHLQHIMNKLGFSSRAQIAAWGAKFGSEGD